MKQQQIIAQCRWIESQHHLVSRGRHLLPPGSAMATSARCTNSLSALQQYRSGSSCKGSSSSSSSSCPVQSNSISSSNMACSGGSSSSSGSLGTTSIPSSASVSSSSGACNGRGSSASCPMASMPGGMLLPCSARCSGPGCPAPPPPPPPSSSRYVSTTWSTQSHHGGYNSSLSSMGNMSLGLHGSGGPGPALSCPPGPPGPGTSGSASALPSTSGARSCCPAPAAVYNTEGWVGHPLDPIGCLFDTLAEASLVPDDHMPRLPTYFGEISVNSELPLPFRNPKCNVLVLCPSHLADSVGVEEPTSSVPPRYHHVPVVGSRDRSETYLTLAVEVALIGLGQQRIMPAGLYAQEKACKQEDRLIAKLQEMELDSALVAVLRRQAIVLLEGGPTSGLGIGIHPESIPMHTFARFMFLALLNYYPDLAYEVGLRAMRLPVLEEHEDTDEGTSSSNVVPPAFNRYPRWFTLGHIETQQCSLASTMLSAAKGWCPFSYQLAP